MGETSGRELGVGAAPVRHLARERSSAVAGYTLIELVVAVMVLTISIGAISMSLATTASLNEVNHQTSTALDVAQSALEAVQGETFEEVFVRYNGTTADDPPLGASPGTFLAVPSLTLRNNDPDGFVGSIEFPGDGVELREDVIDDELGMPRDLNADGNIDANNHALDYTILPVRVVLEWTGPGGQHKLQFVSTISRKE